MAYQGAKYENETQSELIKKWIYNLEFKFLELPYPDLNIFFDVPIDFIKEKLIINKREGEDRHYLNGKNDIHEMDIKFQERVRNNYLTLKKYKNFKIINCSYEDNNQYKIYSPEEIFNKYINYIKKII